MQARGYEGAHSIRLGEASRWVVALDHMVAGVAGGDQITAAVFVVDDQLDYWIRIRCNGMVLEDQQLTSDS